MPVRCRGLMVAAALGVIAAVCLSGTGCQFSVTFGNGPVAAAPIPPAVPREHNKVAQVAYVIEPPDILSVELLRGLPDRPLQGERLVRSDGTINLGFYGVVRVAGLTIDQAREAVEQHLSAYIRNPKVNLDVYTYNSKAYYIVADGAGFGEQAVRLSFTGNETVLDAITQIGGIPAVGSKKKVWLARPGCGVLPVDWNAIVQCGDVTTNYQLQPGDRIYIQSDPLLRFDTAVAKILNPFERMFGFTLLGATTINRLQNMGRFVNSGQGVVVTGGF